MTEERAEDASSIPPLPAGVLAVRAGHGANCSSVGSVVDLLFVASVGAGALLVAITAALADRERAVAQREEAGNDQDEDGAELASSSEREDVDAGEG